MHPQGRAKLLQGETVSEPGKDYSIIFKDFFAYGLRLPSVKFLHQVLEEFDVSRFTTSPQWISCFE